MNCSARSPDLNPLDHLWDMLQRLRFTLCEPTSNRTESNRPWWRNGMPSVRDPFTGLHGACLDGVGSATSIQAQGGHTCTTHWAVFFMIRAILNILGINIHDMVATVTNCIVCGYAWFSLVVLRHARHLSFLYCWSLGTRIHILPLYIVA